MKKWITVVTTPDNRVGKIFDRIIYVLILLSLALFVVETLPEAQEYTAWFTWAEYIIVAVFTVEYLLRLAAQGRAYAFGFYGVIDLLAILPTYLSLGTLDLRSIRVLRVLRMLRIAKLRRYGVAWERLQVAFSAIKSELAVYFGLTAILLYLASIGIYYCERDAQPEAFKSALHAMWWAVATLTTVGYGDIYPVTAAGRLFTFVILMLGLGIVSVPSGLIASALMQTTTVGDASGDERSTSGAQ